MACGLLGLTNASAQVQRIATDLYAYISANDASANSTFLIGERGILVVDTGLNEQEGKKLLTEIRRFSLLPVRWIVNTHYHPDHNGGNGVVGPDAVIISTAFTREQLQRGVNEEREQRNTGTLAPTHGSNEGAAVTLSGRTGLTLQIGSHAVRIYHPGPGHTRGDLVVFFPDLHAIAAGDLFLNGSCPAMDDGDLENWLVALDQMLSLPVGYIVPGHFALATKKELHRFRDYLAALQQQVSGMFQHGLTLQQVKDQLDLHSYNDLRQFPQYEATFTDNAAAYYRQLQARTRPAEPGSNR